jgi:hypothetical protein
MIFVIDLCDVRLSILPYTSPKLHFHHRNGHLCSSKGAALHGLLPQAAQYPNDEPVRVGCQFVCFVPSSTIIISDRLPNSVTEWASIQNTCGVTFNNTMPNGLVLDPNVAAQSNATTYNVTATPTLPPASTSNCVFGTYTVKVGCFL